jgi:hypothetical protein
VLTGAWFDAALATFGTVPTGDPGRLVVEYHVDDGAGAAVHHQVFAGGTLASWRSGPAADAPDLRLRQPLDAHLAMMTRAGLGNAVLAATTVVDPATGEDRAPPPRDEVVDGTWGRALPEVPTAATFVVEDTLTGSPFGTVVTHYTYERGRLAGAAPGPLASAAVLVRRSYRGALEERAGRLDVLDSLVGGALDGDFRKLPLLLGIYDSDEMREDRRRLTHDYEPALIRLGEILGRPEWAEAALRTPL